MTKKRKPPEGADRVEGDPIPADIFATLPDLSDLLGPAGGAGGGDDDEGGQDPAPEPDGDPETYLAGYTVTVAAPTGLPLLRFTFLGDGRMRAAALGTDNEIDMLVTRHVGAVLHHGLINGGGGDED